VEYEFPTCMQLTRLPFWTELNFWVLLEKTVAALRPEKAFTVEASDDPTLEEAAAKAAGATTAEAATMEAMASEASSLRERRTKPERMRGARRQEGRWGWNEDDLRGRGGSYCHNESLGSHTPKGRR
jgi:hypothetical protein